MQQSDKYYVPHGTNWPIIGSIGLFILFIGLGNLLHGANTSGTAVMLGGLAVILYMVYGWFAQVVDESIQGKYNAQVDRSFRMGMAWFIFSEVFFFIAFFGALFYARIFSIPWLGGAGAGGEFSSLIWPNFQATWPLLTTPDPVAYPAPKDIIPAWGLPFWNTVILLTSGVTITWAHHALKVNNRKHLIYGMLATVALGIIFLFLQAEEYGHAYADLNLTLKSGIYGSTFFMLTGFHGMHVTLGTIMLIVITIRCAKGHFSKDNHFAFEAVAWYWHFVDVVWIGLFIFVYWL